MFVRYLAVTNVGEHGCGPTPSRCGADSEARRSCYLGACEPLSSSLSLVLSDSISESSLSLCDQSHKYCALLTRLFYTSVHSVAAGLSMNKLRKSPPSSPSAIARYASSTITAVDTPSRQSRTMMYARTVVTSPPSFKPVTTVAAAVSVPPAVRPVSQAEQYWAARALTAEALLSVKSAHHQEVKAVAAEGEEKRAVSPCNQSPTMRLC